MLLGDEDDRRMVASELAVRVPALSDAARRDAWTHWFLTLAIYHAGGEAWKRWNETLKDDTESQRAGPACCFGGSWDPRSQGALGRLETTALLAMTTEVYYAVHRFVGARGVGDMR